MQSVLFIIHAFSWPLMLIAFFLSYKFTGQKFTMMITRLFALFMIVSGFGMVIIYGFPLLPLFKAILALLLIGSMETMVARKRKGKKNVVIWVIWVILLAIILSIGYS